VEHATRVLFAAARREYREIVAARPAFSQKNSSLISCSASRQTAHASRLFHPSNSGATPAVITTLFL